MYYYCVSVEREKKTFFFFFGVGVKMKEKVAHSGNHSLTNHSGAAKNVQSSPNRSKKCECHRKLNINDDTIAMQNQQQTRRRHQTSDSMLNTVQSKQHGASSMAKQETNRQRLNQQKPAQIIPQENVIIGICTKVFRKCFFSAGWLPVSAVSAYWKIKKT